MTQHFPLKIEAVTEALSKQWVFFFAFKKGGASLLHTLESEAAKQLLSNPYPARVTGCFGGVLHRSTFEAVNLGGHFLSKTEAATEALSKQSNLSGEINSPNYSERLALASTKSSVNKEGQANVTLPIPEGFNLPDREKTLRAAYDLWQPVRDAMPEWVAYMSVRKAHQNGDKSLDIAHQEAEQAYYSACRQCPQFQYYRQVHQQLFPPKKTKEIDWYAEPQEASL